MAMTAAVMVDVAVHAQPASVASAVAIGVGAVLVGCGTDRRRPAVVIPLVLAVAAGMLLIVRDSAWVVGPVGLFAVTAITVAAADQLFAPERWPRAAADQVLAVIDTFGLMVGYITNQLNVTTGAKASMIRGLIMAAVVTTPLVLLLASADAVFGALLRSTAGPGIWRHIVIVLSVTPVALSLAVTADRTPSIGGGRSRSRTGSMTEATIVLGAVVAVLAVWGATQIMVALGGAERLLATAGLTAAQNARQGFFQLVAATALLVTIVAAIDHLTDRTSAADRRCFLVLTSLVGIETLGLVVAAYSRLALYVSRFGTTMLRLSVAWFLAWLALVLVVLIVSVNHRRAGRASSVAQAGGVALVLAGIWMVAFGLTNPEATVASTNLERAQSAPADVEYLFLDLGPDAVPAIVERLDQLGAGDRARLRDGLCTRPTADTGRFLTWNRSRAQAHDALAALACPS